MPTHPKRHLAGRTALPAVFLSSTGNFGCTYRCCSRYAGFQLAFEFCTSSESLDLFG
jgi:hypothetical protein